MSFAALNTNIIAGILSKVSPRAFIAVLDISRRYQDLKQNKYFWKIILELEFPGVANQILDKLDVYKSKYANLKFEKLTTEYPENLDYKSDFEYQNLNHQIQDIQNRINALNTRMTELYKSRDKITGIYQNKIKTLNHRAMAFKEILEADCEKCKSFPTISVFLDDIRMMGFETNLTALRLFKPRNLPLNGLSAESLIAGIEKLTGSKYTITGRTVLLLFSGSKNNVRETEKPAYWFYFMWYNDELSVLEFPTKKQHDFNQLLKSENPEYTLATIYARYGFNFPHK